MIVACSVHNKIVVTIKDSGLHSFRLERLKHGEDNYYIYTDGGFVAFSNEAEPKAVEGNFLDIYDLEKTLYSYRYVDINIHEPEEKDYKYSNWVRNGTEDAIGYSFGNFKIIPGTWGSAVSEDDMRYTYLWGTDFRATNGQSYTDEQIKFFIDASVADIERRLDITIKRKRLRFNAQERGLVKGIDYDTDEAVYDFKFSKISRYGLIKTRHRPIIQLHRLELLSRLDGIRNLKPTTIVDNTKGVLKLMERPLRPSETSSGIHTAIGIYGNQTLNANLFYAIDYDAGFETSDDIPADLREIIAKNAAVNLLNVIGDGLMSGFSSSSLSMDGLSESFSSTQSATSAYFGARIKEYKDDIEEYIRANKHKFGHISMGSL